MARITKPCPACKTTEHFRRDADGICEGCQKLIDFAKERKIKDAKRTDEEVDISTKEQDYALPGYYVTHVPTHVNHKTNQRLQTALHTLIMTMARPSDQEVITTCVAGEKHRTYISVPDVDKTKARYTDWETFMVMRKDQALAVNELDRAIRTIIHEVASEAYESGSNLLMKLASGSITTSEFNERREKAK